jgi:hypothetical protein
MARSITNHEMHVECNIWIQLDCLIDVFVCLLDSFMDLFFKGFMQDWNSIQKTETVTTTNSL